MKCGITDIARILGITTSAIRYFEKEHLINVGKRRTGTAIIMKRMYSGFFPTQNTGPWRFR